MINVQGLSVSFNDHAVLKNISIDFEEGLVHGIVGLNGAGKTTLFNVLAKMLKPDSGDIKQNGTALGIKHTAYLETANFFFSRITGNEYLKIFKQTNTEFNLAALQEYFKLPLDELIENYSTGMKKKLALLAVLKQGKPIFILDEPFNGLDLETNKVLEIIIVSLKQKQKTVFVSSHIIDPLLTTCDKIHLLENGCFVKTYFKSDFSKIEEDLFGKLKTEATEVISKAV
ncbi:MAG: ATP-binding cassette domain-containing protein [Chitinophagaceae bacterium]|nr:ATP-binding cassette domain-containing protein [Chitinophagaceae bacterium]MBK7308515.1 ATP-binding cassette domain-containing protein [Chitinophagaceae bacterium]MBK9486771.1 ATP-binding cassette domain-containing protein [Chitinophagaceae bacterium]MBL0199334.1 ATP-binding cassette domain-containing protein [Chitinophagaceae bacterium]